MLPAACWVQTNLSSLLKKANITHVPYQEPTYQTTILSHFPKNLYKEREFNYTVLLLIWKKVNISDIPLLGSKVTKYRSMGTVSSFLFCNIYKQKYVRNEGFVWGKKNPSFTSWSPHTGECAALGFDFLLSVSVDLMVRPCLASRHWGWNDDICASTNKCFMWVREWREPLHQEG